MVQRITILMLRLTALDLLFCFKAKPTIFIGETLKGQVKYTICKGQIVDKTRWDSAFINYKNRERICIEPINKDKFIFYFKIFFPILIIGLPIILPLLLIQPWLKGIPWTWLVYQLHRVYGTFFTFLTGIVSAMVPIIGHHLGRGKRKKWHLTLANLSTWLSDCLYLAYMVVFLAPPVLNHIGTRSSSKAVAVLIFGTFHRPLCCF